MDRALIERMVGAAVLVLALVLFAPALLDGERKNSGSDASDRSRVDGLRTEVIVLNEPLNADSVASPEPEHVELPASVEQRAVVAKPMPQAEVVATPVQKAEPEAPAKPAQVAKATVAPVVKKPVAKPAPAPKPKPKPKSVESAPSPSQAKTSVPLRSPPPAGFGVQLGSFSSRDNAEQFALTIRKEGFEVFLTRAAASSGAVYRVYAGPRPTRDAADKLSAVLAGSGRSVMVVDLNAQGGR